MLRYSWGVSQNRLAARLRPVLSSPGPRRRRRTWETPKADRGPRGPRSIGAPNGQEQYARPPGPAQLFRGQPYPSTGTHTQDFHRRMDAKQVWRAALGEL